MVIQYGRTRGMTRTTGVAFDLPEVHRWVVGDGRAVEAHFAIDTQGMLERLAWTPELSAAPLPASNAPPRRHSSQGGGNPR